MTTTLMMVSMQRRGQTWARMRVCVWTRACDCLRWRYDNGTVKTGTMTACCAPARAMCDVTSPSFNRHRLIHDNARNSTHARRRYTRNTHREVAAGARGQEDGEVAVAGEERGPAVLVRLGDVLDERVAQRLGAVEVGARRDLRVVAAQPVEVALAVVGRDLGVRRRALDAEGAHKVLLEVARVDLDVVGEHLRRGGMKGAGVRRNGVSESESASTGAPSAGAAATAARHAPWRRWPAC